MVVLLLTGLGDLAYTIYQDVTGDYGGVAQFLFLSSSVLVVTMVRTNTCAHVRRDNILRCGKRCLYKVAFDYATCIQKLVLINACHVQKEICNTNSFAHRIARLCVDIVCVYVVQVLAVLVLWHERREGVRSSALFTIFWLGLVAYSVLKIRSLILLAEDEVCLCL